ncbi:MAG: hypothetical protein ACXACP_01055 [Candidatus Hodarchaeales archaeon]|jgi:hypothetical protein
MILNNDIKFSLVKLGEFFLQTDSYTIFDYFIVFLGPGAVLFFTFYLLWAGRRKNHKIINVSKDALLEVFSDEFDDLIIEQLSSNGGLLFPQYKKSQSIHFKDFRVVFALEERHLMLSVVISWFSGQSDYIAMEANPKKGRINTKIQIIPNKEEGQIKKHQDLLFSLEDLELNVERIDELFLIRASSKRTGMYFLGNKELLKQLYAIREAVVRISIDSSDNPSVRIYAKIDKNLDLAKMRRLFITLCERINEISEKKVMKKN